MQGVNTIYFEKNVDFKNNKNSDTAVLESRIAYFNSIKNAIETACPGWFNNIEFEIITNGSVMIYNLYFIIDNIPLLTIKIETGAYSHEITVRTSYNSGNNNFLFYYKGNSIYTDGSNDTISISAIVYSTNFCGIELSNKQGTNYKSTVIMFCKSNINNTVIICPSKVVNNDNSGKNLLTAYSDYEATNNAPELYITAKTVHSPSSESNNRYRLDNYVISRSGNSNVDSVAERGIINEKFILTPVHIGNQADEYCPGAYYIKNSPIVLSTACNAILEIGKDFYFTNGIVAFKLT